MYSGFISGVLSLAALILSIGVAFTFSGDLAAYLQKNDTLVNTLMYYTDAASRIGNLDISMLSVNQVSQNALMTILEKANLPAAFEKVFLSNITKSSSVTISEIMTKTIVNVSISIISFLVCFLVCYILATIIVHMINYVFELPVLRHLDSLAGGFFGFIRGYMMLLILFTLVPIVLAIAPVEQLSQLLEPSTLATYFDSKLILTIIGRTLS